MKNTLIIKEMPKNGRKYTGIIVSPDSSSPSGFNVRFYAVGQLITARAGHSTLAELENLVDNLRPVDGAVNIAFADIFSWFQVREVCPSTEIVKTFTEVMDLEGSISYRPTWILNALDESGDFMKKAWRALGFGDFAYCNGAQYVKTAKGWSQAQ